VEYKGIVFEEGELRDFQRVFPGSPAANLLNRIIVQSADKYENILHDASSSLEQLRFAQGAMDSRGELVMMIKGLMDYRFEQASGDEREELDDDGEEATPAVDF